MELRQKLQNILIRGSISLNVETDLVNSDSGRDSLTINTGLASAYKNKFEKLGEDLGLEISGLYNLVVGQPEVIRFEEKDPDENDWLLISETIDSAVNELISFREAEGEKIQVYLNKCINRIRELADVIEKEEGPRKESVRNRLISSIGEAPSELKYDDNRLEQEMIFYLEKLDIGEEKSRLSNHLDYFVSTLQNEAAGKKLGFISQELGREVNTIGAKANYFPIQQAVVEMKEEIEKLKEQLLNVL
jgi:uncharacterized protein (TIGR00255 family)